MISLVCSHLLCPLRSEPLQLIIRPDDITQSTFIVGELTLGIFTANVPILSVIATRAIKKISDWTGLRLSAFSPSRNLPSKKVPGRVRQHNLLDHQGGPKALGDPESVAQSHLSIGRPSPSEYVEFGKDDLVNNVVELREIEEKNRIYD